MGQRIRIGGGCVLLGLLLGLSSCDSGGVGSSGMDRLVTSNRELRNSVTILRTEVARLKNELQKARKAQTVAESARGASAMKEDEVRDFAVRWQQGGEVERRSEHARMLFRTKEQILQRFGRPTGIVLADDGERWIWREPANAFFLWLTFSAQGYVTQTEAGTS